MNHFDYKDYNKDDNKDYNKDDKYNQKPKRNDTLRLTQELNEKYFNEIRKNIEITNLSIIKDDIQNFKPLTPNQLSQLDKLTELEKIDIIHLYNTMFSTLEDMMVK
uniref:Uncharacterized protein n=1 Tax=viral metagenome TaxID=1070528 RepID=A0A6C0DIN2_9ZZZZ